MLGSWVVGLQVAGVLNWFSNFQASGEPRLLFFCLGQVPFCSIGTIGFWKGVFCERFQANVLATCLLLEGGSSVQSGATIFWCQESHSI